MCIPVPATDSCKKRYCYYGYCLEWVCPECRKVACGFGPLMCKCDAPRWFIYPDMGKKPHVAAKENTMRKQKRSKRSKKQ
jgi:hypothetical protein